MTRTKVLVAVIVLLAFVGGTLFANYVQPRLAGAAEEQQAQAVVQRRAAPRVVRVVEYPAYREYPQPRRRRTVEQEVLIVAGSAGAGAAIGAVAGGRKGAAIGAVSGGIAGLVYDLATRDRNRNYR